MRLFGTTLGKRRYLKKNHLQQMYLTRNALTNAAPKEASIPNARLGAQIHFPVQ
jgi:hypothetical protein